MIGWVECKQEVTSSSEAEQEVTSSSEAEQEVASSSKGTSSLRGRRDRLTQLLQLHVW